MTLFGLDRDPESVRHDADHGSDVCLGYVQEMPDLETGLRANPFVVVVLRDPLVPRRRKRHSDVHLQLGEAALAGHAV